MTRRYWTEGEMQALYHGFEFRVGLPWSDAVDLAANAGSTRMVKVTPEQWAHVAAIVGTRDADQCAKRLQTERRQEQERRHAIALATSQAHQGVAARGVPDEPSPALAMFKRPRPWHCPPNAGRLAGLDVSPYIGKSQGRIAFSFNGRGAA